MDDVYPLINVVITVYSALTVLMRPTAVGSLSASSKDSYGLLFPSSAELHFIAVSMRQRQVYSIVVGLR